jgi:hypothetical protein
MFHNKKYQSKHQGGHIMKQYRLFQKKATRRIFTGPYEKLLEELEFTGELLKSRKKKDEYIIGYSSSVYIIESNPESETPLRRIDAKAVLHNYRKVKYFTEKDYNQLLRKITKGKLNFDELYCSYACD